MASFGGRQIRPDVQKPCGRNRLQSTTDEHASSLVKKCAHVKLNEQRYHSKIVIGHRYAI